MYTRRDFGQAMLAAVPFSAPAWMRMPEISHGVRLGTITYSFNDMPMQAGKDQIDSLIDECKRSRVNLIELMCNHAEPVSEYQAKMAAARAARMAAMAAAAANGAAPCGPRIGKSANRQCACRRTQRSKSGSTQGARRLAAVAALHADEPLCRN